MRFYWNGVDPWYNMTAILIKRMLCEEIEKGEDRVMMETRSELNSQKSKNSWS